MPALQAHYPDTPGRVDILPALDLAPDGACRQELFRPGRCRYHPAGHRERFLLRLLQPRHDLQPGDFERIEQKMTELASADLRIETPWC